MAHHISMTASVTIETTASSSSPFMVEGDEDGLVWVIANPPIPQAPPLPPAGLFSAPSHSLPASRKKDEQQDLNSSNSHQTPAAIPEPQASPDAKFSSRLKMDVSLELRQVNCRKSVTNADRKRLLSLLDRIVESKARHAAKPNAAHADQAGKSASPAAAEKPRRGKSKLVERVAKTLSKTADNVQPCWKPGSADADTDGPSSGLDFGLIDSDDNDDNDDDDKNDDFQEDAEKENGASNVSNRPSLKRPAPTGTAKAQLAAVTTEVVQLIHKRPVSEVLSNAAFKRQLESVLCARSASVSASSARKHTRSGSSSSSSSSSSPSRPLFAATSNAGSESPRDTGFTAVARGGQRGGAVPAPVSSSSGAPVFAQQADGVRSRGRAQEDFVHIDMNMEENVRPPIPPVVERLITETLEGDMEDLMAWRVVSATLSNASVREHLESMIQTRLRAVQADGLSRAPLVLSSRQNRRNARGEHRHSPRHSMQSQQQLAVRAELSMVQPASGGATQGRLLSLENQLGTLQHHVNDLRRMMQAQFEIQMDIQRAIRQEVAAALNMSINSSEPASSFAFPEKRAVPVAEGQCAVCLEQPINSLLYSCGHMCSCFACGMSLKAEKKACPICRSPIKDVVRVFVSSPTPISFSPSLSSSTVV